MTKPYFLRTGNTNFNFEILTLKNTFLFGALLLFSVTVFGQTTWKKQINENIDRKADGYRKVADSIMNWAELGYHEYKSHSILAELLREAGFDIQEGVADIPTAFVATYGSSGPVIGLLAEYDALPGFSQDTVPYRKAVDGMSSGHACGHDLLGTAAVAAAIEIKDLLASGKLQGTIKVIGTPAEEGGSGKVFMTRDGVFQDVDAVLHWHPDDKNFVMHGTSLANISAKFRFKGISSHAAASPAKGRSALDGVEAFNHMTNLMREHIPAYTRIHYVITNGGAAPNVVPDFAEVYYYVRNPDPAVLQSVFDRVVDAAKGAAMGTGTVVEYEIIAGVYNILNNHTLARTVSRNFKNQGGYLLDEREFAFAEQLQETISTTKIPLDHTQKVDTSFDANRLWMVSTDVGDVSWNVPTAGFSAATWVPGTVAHSWQAVASGGMSIGTKGMILAAKVMAHTVTDWFQNPEVLKQAKAELNEKRGSDFIYKPLVGDRNPPFDYRTK